MSRANVEDLYRLSPVQEGILFHSLSASEPGLYVVQLSFAFPAGLEVETFRRAWQRVVERHPILRTSFHWRETRHPMQIVAERVELPFEVLDWRSVSEAARPAEIAAFARDQRERGFELDRAPLMRLFLLRLDDDAYHFVWSFHHLLMDGWSLSIVLREVFTLYRELRAGRRPALPHAPPYGDFIDWLENRELAAAEAYWRRALAGFDEPSLLCAGRRGEVPAEAGDPSARPEAGSSPRGELSHHLSPELTRTLGDFARSQRITLNILAQSSWGLVLGLFTGRRDVLFGATMAGRPDAVPGVEDMVGLFINTLPARVRLAAAGSVGDWLREQQLADVERRAFESTPLAEVRGWSDVAPGAELFDTLFVFESYPVGEASGDDGDGLRIEEVKGEESSHYPLAVVVVPGESIELRTLYDRRRISRSLVRRILDTWQALLERIVADPDQPLARLPLLSDADAAELARWNDTAADYPRRTGIHHRFQAVADRHGDAVALVGDGGAVTYRQLAARAAHLAGRLGALGVERGDLVGVCGRRSTAMVVAHLGVLAAGGAYVPLDPSYPRERLAFMLADTGLSVVVLGAGGGEALGEHGAATLEVEAIDWAAADGAAEPLPQPPTGGDDLAYVMYTSGSTGRPKGVAVPHRGPLRLVLGASYVDFGPGETFLHFAPTSFDAATFEIWGALLHGARLVVPPAHDLSLAELAGTIERHRVSTLWLTAALFDQVVAHHGETLGRVRQLLAGGDVLSPARVREVLETQAGHGGGRVVNGYGPTESTTFAACHPMATPEEVAAPVSIGRPIANTVVHVVDRHLRPVPVGAPGELLIGGDGLARGYHARPALTAERFVPDPLGTAAGGRLYRTGDRVRHADDGTLSFLGRIDQQVKIRGYRIEPGEVEAVLGEHPSVAEVAVIPREEAGGGKRLVAFVAAREGASPSHGELAAFLAERLPAYMVPALFVELPSLPVTANGKVDRAALERRDLAADAAASGAATAPLSPLEELIAGVWCDVLERPRVGRDDDFFELGGHSLLATQVISRIREVLGVELPLTALFDVPTVAGLAAVVEQEQGSEAPQPPPIVARGESEAPLSLAQKRLWVLDRFQPGEATYHIPMAMRLRGPLDTDALDRALAAIIDRHAVLRTTFEARDGEPVQVVAPRSPVELETVEVPPSVEWRALAEAEAVAPFDLETGPLLRAKLFRLAPGDAVFLLTQHHLVSDGWSLGVLLRELRAAYVAFAEGREPELPPLEVQYADFAAWQREWLDEATLATLTEFWRQRLGDAPAPLELPTDRPRPTVQSLAGAHRTFDLPAPLHQGLVALAREEGATLFMVLLAAFHAFLARLSGQTRIAVGSPIAGRTHRQTERLIGFFVNTLVLAGDLGGDPVFADLVADTRDLCLDAYAHQHLPFEHLVDALHPERDTRRPPIVQVYFALQEAPGGHLDFGPLEVEPLSIETGSSRVDLTLTLDHGPGGLGGLWEYSTALFDATTIERWHRHWQALLAAIVDDPELLLSELPLFSTAERHQLIVEWNDSESPQPPSPSLYGLFREQVARRPDAPAVVTDAGSLTYRELDARARHLARRLRALGVGPESTVVLALERGEPMVRAVLGILAAGGTYVPVDPSYPAERQRLMVEDTAATVMVTETSRLGDLPTFEGVETLCLDDLEPDAPVDDPPSETVSGGDHLAYVIFTSGSTGRPKGVQVTHRAVVRLVMATSYFDLGPEDPVFHGSTISFDAATFELWAPLLHGSPMVILPPDSLLAADLPERLEAHPNGILFVTTALFNQLTATNPRIFEGVRQLHFGGEAVDPTAVARVLEHGGPDRLIHCYGPTESTTYATWFPISSVPEGATTLPIGRPIDNTTVHVADRHLRLAPLGVVGELLIGGLGLARGYRGRPAATAEKFVPNPWRPHPGERLYRSGDLVRLDVRGAVEFVGRIDHQVKVRGFRIEPGEIEVTLRQHPELRDVLVTVHTGAGGAQRLVAYVVGEGLTPEAVRDLASRRLPDHMVPAQVVVLPAMPLTAHGKVDRRALPDPDAGWGDAERPREAPRTAVEALLCDIWSALLGRDAEHPVGIHENFFDVGGDSILTIQVVARARKRGLHLTPRQLFEHPTVARLATQVESVAESAEPAGPAVGEVPLTPIQAWFFEQPHPHHHFNQSQLLRVPDLDEEALGRALDALIRHHDTLRLAYHDDGDHDDGTSADSPAHRWRQSYTPIEELPAAADLLTVHDLAGHHRRPGDPWKTLERHAQRLQESFQLDRPPLLRAALFRLGGGECRLLLILHHLLVDGVSWRLILEDLPVLYRDLAAGREPTPLPETASFQAWSRHLTALAQPPWLDDELPLWRAMLEPAGRLRLPTNRREIGTLEDLEQAIRELDADTTRALLEEVPGVYHSEINDVLLGSLGRAVTRWVRGSEPAAAGDLVLTLEGHGREPLDVGSHRSPDVTGTLGWFTAAYPVRLPAVAIDPDGDLGQTLKTVRDVLRAIPHKGLGYGLLRYLRAGGSTGLGDPPPPEISFNYLGRFGGEDSEWAMTDEPRGMEVPLTWPRTHALDVDGMVVGGRLRLRLSYGPNLDGASVEALADAFVDTLGQMVEHCRHQTPETPAAGVAATGVAGEEIPRLPRDGAPIPLSHAQERLWALERGPLAEVPHLNHVPAIVHLRGPLAPSTLGEALDDVVGRHEVLRTHIPNPEPGEPPRQVIAPHLELEVPFVDLGDLPEDERQETLLAHIRREALEPFDLATGPMLRARLFRLEATHHVLFLTLHHIVIDAWAFGVLMGDLFTFYRARRDDRPADLPELDVQYADFAAWQRRWLSGGRLAELEGYWYRELHGSHPVISLSDDPGVPNTLTGPAASVRLHLPATRREALQGLARSQGGTLFMALLATVHALLHAVTGRRDLVISSPIAQRNRPELETMVGYFANLLMLRADLTRDPSFAELVAQLSATALDAYAHQELPVELVTELPLEPWRLPPGEIFRTVRLTFDGTPTREAHREAAGEGPTYELEMLDLGITMPDLAIDVSQRDDGLHAFFNYRRDRLGRAFAESLARAFATLVDAAIERPDEPLSTLLEGLWTPPEKSPNPES